MNQLYMRAVIGIKCLDMSDMSKYIKKFGCVIGIEKE